MEKLFHGFLKGLLCLQIVMLSYAVGIIAYKTVETILL